jgi:cysteine desulfurase/selenocysteine lyase
MLNTKSIRRQFKVYKKNPDLHFFDSAASALKLAKAVDAMAEYLNYNGTNVHRGVYKLASDATELYENARESIANVIHANKDEVIFTKSTTHSLNMLAKSLESILTKDDEIIISELEHHSNLLPWFELAKKTQAIIKFIPLENNQITLDGFKKVLTNQTKLVITHHISNVLGYTTPIKEMTKLAHKKNALVVLDAAQSIGHLSLDVKALDVDFVAFSGHKAYGPNGIGVLYGKYDLLETLPPSEFGGEMVDRVFVPSSTWKQTPYKFEAGTPPIAEAIGLAVSLNYLKRLGFKNIYKHEMALRDYVISHLKDEENIEIYNLDLGSTMISFNITGVHPHDTASFLDQHHVAVRAGHHCNQLTMKLLNQVATVRISFGIYNDLNDCDVLIAAIKETRDFFKKL